MKTSLGEDMAFRTWIASRFPCTTGPGRLKRKRDKGWRLWFASAHGQWRKGPR